MGSYDAEARSRRPPQGQAEQASCRASRESEKAFEREHHTIQGVRPVSLGARVHRGLESGKRECGNKDAGEGASGRTLSLQIILASFLEVSPVPWKPKCCITHCLSKRVRSSEFWSMLLSAFLLLLTSGSSLRKHSCDGSDALTVTASWSERGLLSYLMNIY